MNVKYKYKIGTKVFFVKMTFVPYLQTRNVCDGDGFLYSKSGTPIECPKCKGMKTYSNSGSIKEIVREDIVTGVRINIHKPEGQDNNQISIWYFLEDEPGSNECNFFATFEEADATINKKSLMGYTS